MNNNIGVQELYVNLWIDKIEDCQKLINDFEPFVEELFQSIKGFAKGAYYAKAKKRDAFKNLLINLFL